jgi:ComF family protein
MIKTILQGCANLCFPLNCALCGQFDAATAEQPLCAACLRRIPYNQPPFCLSCSRNLTTYTEQGLCPGCVKQPNPFDRAWVLTRYEKPMTTLIRSFKFHNKTSLQHTFHRIAATFLDRYQIHLNADLIIPIPIHPVRFRERTYNQSELLARALSDLTATPVNTTALTKQLFTPRQSELHRNARHSNLKGAFRLNVPAQIINKHILLADDLLTTGATAGEAAVTLKNGGAATVTLIALSGTGIGEKIAGQTYNALLK